MDKKNSQLLTSPVYNYAVEVNIRDRIGLKPGPFPYTIKRSKLYDSRSVQHREYYVDNDSINHDSIIPKLHCLLTSCNDQITVDQIYFIFKPPKVPKRSRFLQCFDCNVECLICNSYYY